MSLKRRNLSSLVFLINTNKIRFLFDFLVLPLRWLEGGKDKILLKRHNNIIRLYINESHPISYRKNPITGKSVYLINFLHCSFITCLCAFTVYSFKFAAYYIHQSDDCFFCFFFCQVLDSLETWKSSDEYFKFHWYPHTGQAKVYHVNRTSEVWQ